MAVKIVNLDEPWENLPLNPACNPLLNNIDVYKIAVLCCRPAFALTTNPTTIMSENAASMSSDCILNAFYVCVHFLLTRSSHELHLACPPINGPPVDIRLHDFSLRYQLDLTCLTQVIRTVHASRHAAYHYDSWCMKQGSNNIEEFTFHTFGVEVNVQEVRDMVRDGQRLGRVEYECQDAYASFIVALDWRRFQETPDSQLLHLTSSLLSLPVVQGLRGLLLPEWPSDSFGYYHGW